MASWPCPSVRRRKSCEPLFSSAWVICPLKWDHHVTSTPLWLSTLTLGVTSLL